MCTVSELAFGDSLSRDWWGGKQGAVKPLRLLPDSPKLPRTSKLVISHFFQGSRAIPATDTFDMADADIY